MLRQAAKTLLKLSCFTAAIATLSGGVLYYNHRHSEAFKIQQLQAQFDAQRQRLEQDKQHLEEQKKQLETVVTRLEANKRVAEVLVTDQSTSGGSLRTTLLFVEYARDGSSLPPRSYTIEGNSAHIDAMVIKFDHEAVALDDPLRGHSIALFRRLFGDSQSPEDAFQIDAPGQIPDVYRGDPKQSAPLAAFEKELWQNFWRLADDKDYRQAHKVRVVDGESLWGPFVPDKLYTITLDADGGMNLTSEPLKGIYREAMKQRLTKSE